MKLLNFITVDDVPENLHSFIEQLTTDQLLFVTESQQVKTNIGTSYVDIFPAAISGNTFFVDTTGFTKLAMQLYWSKGGGGVSNHDFRIINDADVNQVVVEKTNITGVTEDANISLSAPFLGFTGKWRLQAKAGNTTDDPTFLGLRLYLRR